MLFCQLGHAKSLREICGGLAASEGKLRQRGGEAASAVGPRRLSARFCSHHREENADYGVVENALGQAKLAPSNIEAQRSITVGIQTQQRVLETEFPLLLGSHLTGGQRPALLQQSVKHRLVQRPRPMFVGIGERAGAAGKPQRRGVLRDEVVFFYQLAQHEVRVARQMQFTPGTLLVFDRGYTDYDWFASLQEQGVHFVTRLKIQRVEFYDEEQD